MSDMYHILIEYIQQFYVICIRVYRTINYVQNKQTNKQTNQQTT